MQDSTQYDDEIEQYESSDPYAFGPSSPTPNHPRSFVAPATQQAPARRSAVSQLQYSQPRMENRSQGCMSRCLFVYFESALTLLLVMKTHICRVPMPRLREELITTSVPSVNLLALSSHSRSRSQPHAVAIQGMHTTFVYALSLSFVRSNNRSQ